MTPFTHEELALLRVCVRFYRRKVFKNIISARKTHKHDLAVNLQSQLHRLIDLAEHIEREVTADAFPLTSPDPQPQP